MYGMTTQTYYSKIIYGQYILWIFKTSEMFVQHITSGHRSNMDMDVCHVVADIFNTRTELVSQNKILIEVTCVSCAVQLAFQLEVKR